MTDDMVMNNSYHFVKNYPDIPIINPSIWNNETYLESLKSENYDVMFGNPPCSGLSSLNRNASVDKDVNNHLFEYFNVVETIQPKVFFIENAPTLTNLGLPILKKLVEQLNHLYKFTFINDIAGHHNVAMHRRRTFVMGWRKDCFDKIPYIYADISDKFTVKDALAGLNKDSLNMEFDSNAVLDDFKLYDRIKPGSTVDLTLVEIYDEVKDQLTSARRKQIESLANRLKTKASVWEKSSVRLVNEEWAPSISSLTKLIHPIENRDLYIREYARLMGYPDDFKFYPNECQCSSVQCIAQGVPANFIKYAATQIKQAFNATEYFDSDVVYINQTSNTIKRLINEFSYNEFLNCNKITDKVIKKEINLFE